jgi:hypothetical protein
MKQLLQSLPHCHRFIPVFGAKRIPRAIWLCALLVNPALLADFGKIFLRIVLPILSAP